MSKKWFCAAIVIIMGLCPQLGYGQEGPAAAPLAGNLEASLTRQQKINRASLLEGASDQIRVDAAIELLLSDDKLARQVLIDVLKQNDNAVAQAAVCKALAQSRSWQAVVRSKNDFIEPLFAILLAQPDVPAKLAAEATVIFEYKEIVPRLEKIASDDTADVPSRLHVIYALKLRPEKNAIFILIKLLDNKNKQVADAAALALQDSLGIPAGTDTKVWEQIAKELDRKSPDEFIRDRLVRQEARVHQLETSMKRWQSLYVSALDTLYKGVDDDAAKTAFLTERLSSDEPELQLWAIRRVAEWRMGNKPLPQGFGPVLLSLVSANDPTVRLETAKLLALTSYLGPAPVLLMQIQVEKDEEVKNELFVALGEACNYAYVFKSEVTVSEDIQKATRELAVSYLADSDAKKSQKGAEVFGKLLVHNSVDKDTAQKYLVLLAQRYEQTKAEPNSPLRPPLLDVMAGLCGQNAAYRAQAVEIFGPIFVQLLADKSNAVREAAVAGLIKIDGPKALGRLSTNGMANDPSAVVRTSMIDLAGKIGGPNDLVWLSKINTNGDGEAAWRAVMEIFKRSDATMLAEWISRFETDAAAKLTPDRKMMLLEMAEQKAGTENNAAILSAVRKRLADCYDGQGQFDKAAKYYGMLAETASGADKDKLLVELLDVRIKARQFDAASQLVANRLLEKDLDVNDVYVKKVGEYFTKSPNKDDVAAFAKSLAAIGGVENKPKWQQQLASWRKQAEPNRPPAVAPVIEPNKTATVAAPTAPAAKI
jgi:HEAT repeat protein